MGAWLLDEKHPSSVIPARNFVISPPHIITAPLPSPAGQAQEDMLSEGTGPRDGEKERKGSRTRGEVEENEMEMKRKLEKKGDTERW